MRTVLAAIDCSPAARPVLEAALGLARLTGGTASAVHVRQDPRAATPQDLADHSGVTLTLLEGAVEPALLDCVAAPEVALAVLGARATPAGRRPCGRTARRILERTNKPIVVVPPEAAGVRQGPFRRLLVPLEGSDISSRAVVDTLAELVEADVELVVLHVYTEATTPRMLDRPLRDVEMIGSEFLARHLPQAGRVEFRSGPVDRRVLEVCDEEGADLVVLSWSQRASEGRAAVVRGVLSHALVPVLLLPVAAAAAG